MLHSEVRKEGYNQFIVVPQQQAKLKVQTALVKRSNLWITVSTNGTVQPEVLVNVSPKAAGILKQLLVQEGDSVQKGQDTTIVILTHDATVAAQTKRVIHMQDEVIVETGKCLQT